MYKHNFLAGIISFTCFILAIPSLGTALTPSADNAMHSMKALKAATTKLGVAKVQGNDLYFGDTKASDKLITDAVKKPGVGTIFVKNGSQYMRMVTTVLKDDGTSAVGTALDADNTAVANLNKGEGYVGAVKVFGKTYDAEYEPIKDASGAVIGALFVGYPKG